MEWWSGRRRRRLDPQRHLRPPELFIPHSSNSLCNGYTAAQIKFKPRTVDPEDRARGDGADVGRRRDAPSPVRRRHCFATYLRHLTDWHPSGTETVASRRRRRRGVTTYPQLPASADGALLAGRRRDNHRLARKSRMSAVHTQTSTRTHARTHAHMLRTYARQRTTQLAHVSSPSSPSASSKL